MPIPSVTDGVTLVGASLLNSYKAGIEAVEGSLAGLEEYVAGLLPWVVEVPVLDGDAGHTNWEVKFVAGRNVGSTGTTDMTGGIVTAVNSVWRRSDGTQNAQIEFNVLLGAGTWSIRFRTFKSSNNGIMHWYLNDASLATYGAAGNTFDTYSATSYYSALGVFTGIVIPVSANYRVKCKMESKNGSSSGYNGGHNSIVFVRTA